MQGADSCLAAGRLRDRGSKACTSDRFNLRDDRYYPVFMANKRVAMVHAYRMVTNPEMAQARLHAFI